MFFIKMSYYIKGVNLWLQNTIAVFEKLDNNIIYKAMTINILYGWGKIVSRAINFLLIAAISAVVLSGCNKERDDDGKGTIPDDNKGYTLEVKFPSPGVPYTGGILSGEIKSYKT